ncbi:hypothetical protein [Microbacterium murale]|uniref:Uncharacterized protein n=1 Tax=Microbacterium murale TaxID=1081040 RepID=A0ABU0P7I4_9MICO|nr:hypothetical protein [Microbacterium murale]MDQ0642862.1 hypothetical protein [Microbacterium murale]
MTNPPNETVAPRFSLPKPRPVRQRGIHAFVWDAWPWVNWLLPIFFCFHGWLGSGGWETLLLTVLSPIIVPVFALLASLPRLILRKRGHTTAPGPMVWLLFLNGWSWFIAPLTIPGPTDGATIPSLLQSLVVVPLSDGFQGLMFIGCCILGALSWVALLVLAGTLHPLPATAVGIWRIISWGSAFLVPMLFAVTVVIGVGTTANHLDAASETSGLVHSRSLQDQAELATERYEQTQQAVSEIRALIADDDWHMLGGLERNPYACRSLNMDCYLINADFSHDTAGTGLDRDALIAQIESLGWKPTEGGRLVDADGRELQLSTDEGGFVQVDVESPWWWGDSWDIQDVLPDPGTRPETYAADEWPSL